MSKSAEEKGIAPHVDLCVGYNGFPGWAGIVRESTPGMIPENTFWLIQNARLSGGRLVSRGGQSKVNSSSIGASVVIEGVYDAGDLGA